MIALLFSCKLVTNANPSSRTVSAFRIVNGDISGWTEAASSGYVAFTASTMNALVDGDAPKFTSEGMLEGFRQNLDGADSKTLEAFVMDFGTDSAALNMFIIKKNETSGYSAIPGYSDSVAIADLSGLGACVTWAYFGRYFFKLTLGNYSDNTSKLNDAALFLDYYKNKEKLLN
jgi:hypothetical protein